MLTQEQKNIEYRTIVDQLAELYEKKNTLYGDSFNRQMHKYGLVAGCIPLDNKLSRIISIVQGAEDNGESLEDSLIDLASYSIIFLIHLKEKKQMEDKE